LIRRRRPKDALCGSVLLKASEWGISRAEAWGRFKGWTMDYKDAGAIKKGSNKPRHSEHNAKGSRKNPFGKSEGKAELLARMKAAVKARQDAS